MDKAARKLLQKGGGYILQPLATTRALKAVPRLTFIL